MLVDNTGSRWETYLFDVIYAFRTAPSDRKGFSLFYLTYGRHPGKKHNALFNRTTGNTVSELAYN